MRQEFWLVGNTLHPWKDWMRLASLTHYFHFLPKTRPYITHLPTSPAHHKAVMPCFTRNGFVALCEIF
jgi:hypothetical protein